MIDRNVLKQKIIRMFLNALKEKIDEKKMEDFAEEFVEVIYDDVYLKLKEEVEEKVEKGEVSNEFNLLRSEIKILAETMKMGFEAIEKRFEDQNQIFNKRFEEQTQMFNKRFEEQNQMFNKRFEDLIHYFDKRFEDMNRRMTMLTWIISLWLSLLSIIMVVFKFIQ